MKLLKIVATIALIHIVTAPAAPAPASSSYWQTMLKNVQKNQTVLTGASLGITAASYLGYALYLDSSINNKNCFWHWATHNLKDGVFDQIDLLTYIHTRYAALEEIHPLTAMYAALHDVEKEISYCLTLRSMVQTLRIFKLDGLLIERAPQLDRKLESLYLLKMALNLSCAETRSRCRKSAL